MRLWRRNLTHERVQYQALMNMVMVIQHNKRLADWQTTNFSKSAVMYVAAYAACDLHPTLKLILGFTNQTPLLPKPASGHDAVPSTSPTSLRPALLSFCRLLGFQCGCLQANLSTKILTPCLISRTFPPGVNQLYTCK